MRTKTKKYTVKLDRNSGADVENKKGTNLLAITSDGDNVWFPPKAKRDVAISYIIHEKGDTFIATNDSKTTKGEIMGADCPEGKEDEPLFLEGETVTRRSDSIEFVGFASEEMKSQSEELDLFAGKAAILAKLGVAVHI